MRHRQTIRREGDTTQKRRQVRRTFVDPSKLKASELKALVCLYLYNKPAPFLTGHAFCTTVLHPSVSRRETIIPWKIINSLVSLKLAAMDLDTNVVLTGAGKGIGRSLATKPILGYD